MFKKMKENSAVFNPEIEAGEVLSILTSGMPKWQWRITKDKGDHFEIEGKRRWHRLSVIRSPNGNIGRFSADSSLWAIFTFGLTAGLSELFSSSQRHGFTALKLLKERVHRPEL